MIDILLLITLIIALILVAVIFVLLKLKQKISELEEWKKERYDFIERSTIRTVQTAFNHNYEDTKKRSDDFDVKMREVDGCLLNARALSDTMVDAFKYRLTEAKEE